MTEPSQTPSTAAAPTSPASPTGATSDDTAVPPLFPLGPDLTPYRRLDVGGVSVDRFRGEDVLVVEPEALRALSEAAFRDINHFLRPGHLQQLASILDDPEASENDRYVAMEYLKNASIAAGGVLPMCQDTGTAIITAKKGRQVWTPGADEQALGQGVLDAYAKNNLRYSQLAPLSMYEEANTRTNLPAQIDIAQEGGGEYKLQFMAKGGGSANKTFLFQSTPSTLDPERLVAFLDEKIRTLGTAACPPYHLAIVIGGLSAELNLKTVKMASSRYLDALPITGSAQGHAFRDLEMEAQVLELTRQMGIGAQFGGKYFCHDVRVIRLPRHGASLPIGLGVSCGADRQAMAKITPEGVFLEQLETDPARFLPDVASGVGGDVGGGDAGEVGAAGQEAVAIDLSRPMDEIRAQLSALSVTTRVMLTGTMIVARDLAHAKIRARLEAGEPMPAYFKDHPVYYAGPAKTPEGYASGAFGPTTAGRMDAFVDQFQALGGSMVMLAKGNRSPQVREACARHGGFYLGTIGGVAAKVAQEAIKAMDVLEYPELGMEAIWKIEVENFPAFVIIDDKGNDFFKDLKV